MPRNAFTNSITAFRGARMEYEAMRENPNRRRRPGVTSTGSGADYHLANEGLFTRAREYARAMVRDDEVIQFVIERSVINFMRKGFTYYPQTGDSGLNKELWNRWTDWGKNPLKCDVELNLSWMEMQQVAAFQFIMDGEFLSVGTNTGALQHFEADRLRTPRSKNRPKNIFHGIEMGPNRQRRAYHFTKQVVNPTTGALADRDGPRIPLTDDDNHLQVFHLYQPNRFSQSRGMTRLKAVFDLATRRSDIDFALLVKEQMTACLAWEEQYADPNSTARPDMQMGSRETVTRADGETDTLEEIGPGSIVRPAPGKKLEMHSPNIPSVETMQHLRMCMQILCLNLGVPLCVGMMDPSEGNFSAYRAAVEQAKLGWEVLQELFDQRYCRPVYEFRIRAEIDEAKDLKRYLGSKKSQRKLTPFAAKCHKPKWRYIQPLHDAQADAIRIEHFLAGHEEVIAEQSRDPDDVIKETLGFNARCVIKAIRFAKRIKEKTGVEVNWRDVYNRALPTGATVSARQDDDDDDKGSGARAQGPAKA